MLSEYSVIRHTQRSQQQLNWTRRSYPRKAPKRVKLSMYTFVRTNNASVHFRTHAESATIVLVLPRLGVRCTRKLAETFFGRQKLHSNLGAASLFSAQNPSRLIVETLRKKTPTISEEFSDCFSTSSKKVRLNLVLQGSPVQV
jgi:hypothetical protein